MANGSSLAFGILLPPTNTGITPTFAPTLDPPLDAARKLMETNVLAALSWTRKAIAAGLGADGAGAVVNVASVAGLGATGVIGMYGVSKAALIALTRELGLQLAPAVRANPASPPLVQTQIRARLFAQGATPARRPTPRPSST